MFVSLCKNYLISVFNAIKIASDVLMLQSFIHARHLHVDQGDQQKFEADTHQSFVMPCAS